MIIGIPVVGIGYILWATMVNSYVSLLIVYVGIIALGVNGGFFHPALAVANNWFVRRRATSMAVISTAVGVGGADVVGAWVSVVTVHEGHADAGARLAGVVLRTGVVVVAFTAAVAGCGGRTRHEVGFVRALIGFWITQVDGAQIPIVAIAGYVVVADAGHTDVYSA